MLHGLAHSASAESRRPGDPAATTGSRQIQERTLRRRTTLLFCVVLAAVATLVLALVARRGALWAVHLAVDALLAAYVGVLVRLRNAAAQEEMARHGLRG